MKAISHLQGWTRKMHIPFEFDHTRLIYVPHICVCIYIYVYIHNVTILAMIVICLASHVP